MLEQKDQPELRTTQLQRIPPPQLRNANKKQRHIMLVALVMLVIALALVIVKDWDFWFPSSSTPAVADVPQTPETQSAQSQSPSSLTTNTSASASQAAPKTKSLKKQPEVPQSIPTGIEPIVTNRTVLPPLEVEVVAGNTQHAVQPKNNSVNVEMQSGVPPTSPSAIPPAATSAPPEHAPVVNATEQVRLSPSTVKAVAKPVQPTYPMLAKQMKVQGSVILQALIGRNGSIQDLRVLSGPSILSTAALEAVKQWHFKPYYQDGAPVDTEARITVNFTISTY